MLQKILDQQYRRPRGLLGRYVGRLMARQHSPENLWTLAQLNVQPTDRVLEIGCGPGMAIEALSRVVTQGHISAVDVSAVMGSAARRRNARAVAQGRVEIRQSDVTALLYADAAFDKAYSIHSLYFWTRPHEALREIRRVLGTGGLLVLTVLPRERMVSASGGEVTATPDFIPYSGAEMQTLLIENGFGDTRIAADLDTTLRSNYSVIGVAVS